MLSAGRTLAVDAETLRVVEAMESRGVRPILLRGAAFADLLECAAGERSYVDTDLLIEPAAFSVAEKALRQLGYHESELERLFTEGRPQHAHTWISERGAVDLHRTLIGVPLEPERVWHVLRGRTERLTLLGRDVEVLTRTGRAFALALHAAQHPGDAGVQEDVRRAVALLPSSTWQEAASLSTQLDAEASFAAGLRMTPSGAELADGLLLEKDPRSARLGRGSDAFHLAQGLRWFGQQQGLKAKLRYVRTKALPHRMQMQRRSTLARRGRVGLALAHVYRWLTLAAYLPQAVRVLIRLGRERSRTRT